LDTEAARFIRAAFLAVGSDASGPAYFIYAQEPEVWVETTKSTYIIETM